MKRSLPTLFAPAAVAALLLAGCGASGGDDAADGGDATTTAAASNPDGEVTTTEADDDSPTTEAEGEATTTEADDDTPTTEGGSSGSGNDELCDILKGISDYDKESSTVIDPMNPDWPTIQEFFVENTDEVLAIYDEAIALDTDLSDDLQALRDFTEGTAEVAANSTDLMDFSGKLTAQPGLMEAGNAGQALNEFATTECGFSTGGN